MKFIFCFVLFVTSSVSLTQTLISGIVSGDWTKVNSPYIIADSVVVPKGQTLTIKEGVSVLGKNHKIVVYGQIVAQGSQNEQIIFDGLSEGGGFYSWQGFSLHSSEINRFKNCIIKNTIDRYKGAAISTDQGKLIIDECTFTQIYNSGTPVNTASMLYIENNASVVVSNSEIFDNHHNGTSSILIRNWGKLLIHGSYFYNNYFKYHSTLITNYGELISFRTVFSKEQRSIIDYIDQRNETATSYFENIVINDLTSEILDPAGILGKVEFRNSILLGDISDRYVDDSNIHAFYCFLSKQLLGTNNLTDIDPQFIDIESRDFRLDPNSPCIDKGDPNRFCDDIDGSRNDIGAYGGSNVLGIPKTINFGIMENSELDSILINIYNFGDSSFTIESISLDDKANFAVNAEIPIALQKFETASIEVVANPQISGNLNSYLALQCQKHLVELQINIPVRVSTNAKTGTISGLWTKSESPYIIAGRLEIPYGEKLIIEKGAVIQIDPEIYENNDTQLNVYGDLEAFGTETDSIKFVLVNGDFSSGSWKGIIFHGNIDSSSSGKISYCSVRFAQTGVTINSKGVSITNSSISNNSNNGIVIITEPGENLRPLINSCIVSQNDDYGIKIESYSRAENSICGADIIGNTIQNNPKGGIYVYARGNTPTRANWQSSNSICNTNITNNKILNNGGHGILLESSGSRVTGSVGHFSAYANIEAYLQRNIISNNDQGIEMVCERYNMKIDGTHYWISTADVSILNNTFWANGDTSIWAKDSANVNIQNNIFYSTTDSALVKNNGSALMDLSYNLFKYIHEGENNIIGDPQFINPENMDFSLTENSPAIDAGNPDSDPDPDGTRTDIGAIPFMQPTFVNEANIYTFELLQNYPNPFNSTTEIKYSIPAKENVELFVYDVLGRHVKTLVNKNQQEGWHSIEWDGTNELNRKVASGLYLYKLITKSHQKSYKMLMVK